MSNFILNFLNNCAPPCRCLLCSASCKNRALCPACLSQLPFLTQDLCPQCGLPSDSGGLCAGCLQHPPAFDQTCVPLAYAFPLTELIIKAKFSDRWFLLPTLSQLLLEKAAAAPRPDLLIPLPLHPARLKERGYNQSFELASPLAKQLQLPLRQDILERRINTGHQARLPLAERQKNMRNAFYARQNVAGRHIAIVDDVMTTGASLNAAALCLKKAGAARVDAWILARAL